MEWEREMHTFFEIVVEALSVEVQGAKD